MITRTLAHAPAASLAPQGAAAPGDSPLATRRRRALANKQALAITPAGQGAAMLPQTQTLPFRASASASLRVTRPFLFAVAGAAIGTLLLGIPGTIIGGIAGYLIGR